jgi:CubicO group peptidase (beta-lactamase class C family)
MRLIKIITVTLLFICNVAICQKAKQLDSLFVELYKQKRFNGNILIAEKGKIIYKNSFGLANEQTKEKLNENSIFELASVSKQFTAMAIVILKEKGKINYEDKITKFLPELSNYKNISVRNLLNHTSGLPDYMFLLDSLLFEKKNWKQKEKIATNKNIIEILAKHNPKVFFEPNEKWEYSNTGYALLASIIEKVSGENYSEFLKKEIFIPLNMSNTFIYRRRYEPKKIKNYAFGYIFSDSLQRNILPDDFKKGDINKMVYSLDGIVGDGTVNSTIIDLFKWDRALNENKLISEKSKIEIITPAILNDKSITNYGFGWFVQKNGIYGNLINHNGGWPGYRTCIERQIENDKTIILLQNNNNENTYMPEQEIREILYNIKPLIFINLEKTEIEKFVGNFVTEKKQIQKLTLENGKLLVEFENYPNKMELKPIGKTKFKLIGSEPPIFYDFIIENGEVIKYIGTQPELGVKKESLKVK